MPLVRSRLLQSFGSCLTIVFNGSFVWQAAIVSIAGRRFDRQTGSVQSPTNQNTYMNQLPFSYGGPFVQPNQASSSQQSAAGFQMGNTGQQSNATGAASGLQLTNNNPFSPQSHSGQMSASGYPTGGGSPIGSQSETGNNPMSGFNPMSGSMSGSGSNPTGGFSGPVVNPFNTQRSNNSMSTSGFNTNGHFDPNNFASMMGNGGSFNPNQFVGRSKYSYHFRS